MLDVNGDSFVTPLDVLLTIAYINSSLDGEGQGESAGQDAPYPGRERRWGCDTAGRTLPQTCSRAGRPRMRSREKPGLSRLPRSPTSESDVRLIVAGVHATLTYSSRSGEACTGCFGRFASVLAADGCCGSAAGSGSETVEPQ